MLVGALMALGALLAPVWSALADEGAPVTIVLFHGDGCPHCAAERAFLDGFAVDHPDVIIEEHEVWYDEVGRDLLLATADRMGFEPVGVPVTIVGDTVWVGFDDATAAAIAAAVAAAATDSADVPPPSADDVDPARVVEIPLVGSVAVDDVSLLASTIAIGFVDGVNPCSLWVLSLLLAMVLNRGSRGRVLLVGGVFLFVTAAMYGLYMLGMYSAASYLSGMVWLRVVVAVIAGTFGILQLKDGLGVRAGPSLSISAQRRPGLYSRMRGVASPDGALAATLLGTVTLAVAVSLLETPCTAGLPLLWTALLAEQGVGPLQAAGLFAVYMAVFLLDELAVFALAVVTMRATKVQERHGRLLKLIAGSVLTCLAVVMLVRPEALTSIAGTVVVFGVAAAAAGVAYWLSAGRSSSGGPSQVGSGPSPTGSSPSSSASTSRTTPNATDAG